MITMAVTMQRRLLSGAPRVAPILTQRLPDLDPDLFDIIEREKQRQRNSISLIPSENFTSRSVLDALGSVMQNKYSEGYPGARYYGGNQFIDACERLCQERALAAFRLSPDMWAVNVQPLSGSPANFEVYTAILQPHDRIMSLDLPHGGHLSHGYSTPTKKVSAVSKYFEVLPYRLDEATGLIDYDDLERLSARYRPSVLVSGASAYSRDFDFARLRKIADRCGAYLLYDMAHVSGLIAAGILNDPFEYADIVTTTTHKSLRGPRGAIIFSRKGVRSVDKKGVETMYDLESRINQSVFPGHQGGPHNHTIAALAVALKQASSSEFKEYQQRVVSNCKALCNALRAAGFSIVSGGTENHLILVDLKPLGVDGARVERTLEHMNVALNKNTVPGDKSAMVPGGIRLGTPAMTTRGLKEDDFEKIAEFVVRGVEIALAASSKATSKKLKDFEATLLGDSFGVSEAKANVIEFAQQFPTIGFDESEMKYQD
ncbi:Serine hydroxymethyltransferase [Plasmodiophora brassicae]